MADRKEFELLLKIMGTVDPSLANAANLTKRQLNAFKKDIDAVDNFLWGGFTKAAKLGLAAAAAAGTATIALGKQAYNVGSEFEKEMSKWAATADASVAQYNKAEAAAMKWGRQTTKTATESAQALTYMATAGWDVDRSIEALPRVLKLSEAANLDLAHTSDLVTNAMAATGSEAKDLTRLLDIAAKANNKSNQTAEQLLEAWRKTGANLDNLHVDIAESATALGILANRGKKAMEAGTALNTVILNMTTGTGQAGKMMAKLGISAFDAEGNFKGLKQMFMDLNEVTKDMTDEEREVAFGMLGGKRQVEALMDLMAGLNHEVRDGVSEWDNLYEELSHADGALEKMASRRMDNLWGDVMILKSAMQDAGIRAYKGFAEPMRDAAQIATQAVYDFSENVSDKIGEWYPTFRREMRGAGESVAAFAKPFMDMGGFLVDHGDIVAGQLLGIATAITTFHTAWQGIKAISEISKIAAHWNMGLGAMMGPLAAAGLIAGGTVATITTLNLHMQKMQNQLSRESMSRHFGAIALNAEELRKVARKIVGEKDIEHLTAALEEINKLDNIGANIEAAANGVEKLMMKLKVGAEFDDDDLELLGTSIDTLIKEGIHYSQQQQYTIRLNTKFLFGDSEEGQEVQYGLMRYSASLGKQIQEAGEELGDAYKRAMEDKIISPIEQETIEKLTQNLIDLENQVMTGVAQGKVEGALGKVDLGNLAPDSLLNAIDVTTGTAAEQRAGIDEATAMELALLEQANSQGYYTPEQYENAKSAIHKAGAGRQGEVTKNAAIPFVRTLMEGNWQSGGYSGDIIVGSDQAVRQMAEYTRNRISAGRGMHESASSMLGEILMNLPAAGAGAGEVFSSEELDAIQTYYDQSKELFDNLQALRDDMVSKKVETDPEVIQAASVVDMLEMMLGEGDKFDQLYATMEKVPELKALIEQAQEEGMKLPEGLTEGIRRAQGRSEAEQKAAGKSAGDAVAEGAKEATDGFESAASAQFEAYKSAIQRQFSQPIDLFPHYRMLGTLPTAGGQPAKNALGGIYSSPILTEVAEAGYPEAIIPIRNSTRATELFRQTGELLRQAGANVGGGGAPVYAPTIAFHISGNADEATVRSAMRSSYEEWLTYAQRYSRDQARLAY